MEELQANHRKQLKELQSKITQKKKQATKKTRKGVNDECDNLERELKEQQAAEVQALTNPAHTNAEETSDLVDDVQDLSINGREDENKAVNNGNGAATTSQQSTSEPKEETASSQDSTGPGKKPNRARARLARRQAEQEALFAAAEREASDIPNLKKQERERMVAEFTKRNLKEKEIRADGHCLYSAVADQLAEMGIPLGAQPTEKSKISFLQKKDDAADMLPYRQVRRAAATYIEGHSDDFAPFLEEPLEEYVHKVRDTGEWGGQLELLALARTYGVSISVLQGDGRVEDIVPDQVDAEKRIWLAYYRHGFGLGEHYNSLHKSG